MHLCYFDENKYSTDNPFFFLGGVLIRDSEMGNYEKELMKIQYKYFKSYLLTKKAELHGKEIFHGKGNFKHVKIGDRINLFEAIANFILSVKIPIIIVCLDVKAHRQRYHDPADEYYWSLTLFLERICDYLDAQNDIAVVFGDYEKDKMQKSISSFCNFKIHNTPLLLGRNIKPLKDTIYYVYSHNSRFIQLADIVIYMASRYKTIRNNDNGTGQLTYLDGKLKGIWEGIIKGTYYVLQEWPAQ